MERRSRPTRFLRRRLSLRTKGVYFIMVTLAFAQMLPVFHDTKIGGGTDGIHIYANRK